MIGRRLLPCLVIALAPLGATGEPVRLDAAALGTIAIDPAEASAAREANERLLIGSLLAETDPGRSRSALLGFLGVTLPGRSQATGPGATGPGATGPRATGPGATGPGATGSAVRGEPLDD